MQPYNGFETALNQYYDQWLASLPDEDDPGIRHTFSRRHERAMRRLTALQPKAYYPMVNRAWKRVLLAIIIALLLIFTSMSIGAVRKTITDFFVAVYERFSLIVQKDSVEIDQVFIITELPSGFELHSSKQLGAVVRYEYWHPNGNRLVFWQRPSSLMQAIIDTENIALEEIMLNDVVGYYYKNKEQKNLFWYDNSYCLGLTGDLDKESLVHIAISVRIE